MNLLKTLMLIIAPATIWAAVCDETYYLQSVSQSVYTSTDPKNLGVAVAKTVGPDLAGLDILDTSIAYNVLFKFPSSCTKAEKPVTFRVKPVGKSSFHDSIASGYQVQMFDTNTRVEGFKYDLWVGFFQPAASLNMVLGRYDAKSELFRNWYVAITYTDSSTTNNISWDVKKVFYTLAGPDDSLTLETRVLDQTIRKMPLVDKHKYHFTVQYFKVSFGPTQPIRILPKKKDVSAFQASQNGNLVLIQPGVKAGSSSEPLSLLGMMGNKVATLHPTGYVYQWNGKTSSGAEAPTGVYFVQLGNRILGNSSTRDS